MRVLNIQNQNYNYYQPTCKSVHNYTRDSAGNIIRYHTTCLYRSDMRWKKLITHIIDKYKDVDKVNIYDYACSNGSETYTMLMELIEQCKNIPRCSVSKFCPIIAKDDMPKIIEDAESRKILLSQEEVQYINKYVVNHPDDHEKYFLPLYFFNLKSPDPSQNYYYVRDVLINNVEYSSADILRDYTNIKPDNSIVFFRNVWPYLNEQDRFSLANNLYKHLGDTSMLIIGDFDNKDINTTQLLKNVGFKEHPDIQYVFTK